MRLTCASSRSSPSALVSFLVLRIRGKLQIAIWIGAKLRTLRALEVRLLRSEGPPSDLLRRCPRRPSQTLVPVWPLSFLRARHRPRRRERDRELPGGCGLSAEEQCV